MFYQKYLKKMKQYLDLLKWSSKNQYLIQKIIIKTMRIKILKISIIFTSLKI